MSVLFFLTRIITYIKLVTYVKQSQPTNLNNGIFANILSNIFLVPIKFFFGLIYPKAKDLNQVWSLMKLVK